MSHPNEDLIEHLTEYISEKCVEPDYAILIKGTWGTGKTYFIEQFIEDANRFEKLKNKSKSNFIYVSLNGLNCIEDINNRILNVLHPILDQKFVKIAGTLFDGFVKSKLKLTESNKKEIKQMLNKFKDEVLVFDDLERCSIPITQILGYINQFIEHQRKKVIILANEEEIIKTLQVRNEQNVLIIDKENDTFVVGSIEDIELIKKKVGFKKNTNVELVKYNFIKEKIIGKTFEIKTSIDDVYVKLVEKSCKKSRSFVLKNKNVLVSTISVVNEKWNFRALSHVIGNFDFLWDKIVKKYSKKKDVQIEIFSTYLSIAYEIEIGTITEDELCSLSKNVVEKAKRILNSGYKKNRIELFLQRHNLDHHEMIFPFSIWQDIVCNNHINVPTIEEFIQNSKYYVEENKKEWVKFWYYPSLDDEEAKKTLNSVSIKLKKHEYKDPRIILHIFLTAIELAHYKVKMPSEIGSKVTDIAINFRKYIDYIYQDETMLSIDMEHIIESRGAYGLGFQAEKTPSALKMFEYIKKKMKEFRDTMLINYHSDLLNDMIEDPMKFNGCITSGNSHYKPQLWKVPIFLKIRPEDFVKAFKKVPNKNRYKLIIKEAIKNRYNSLSEQKSYFKEDVETLLKELSFLKGVQKILKNELKEMTSASPTYLQIKWLLVQGIIPAIKKINEYNKNI